MLSDTQFIVATGAVGVALILGIWAWGAKRLSRADDELNAAMKALGEFLAIFGSLPEVRQ